MPRIPRNFLKPRDEVSFFHLISHTVWEAHRPFSSFEKEYFLHLLRRLTQIYLVDVISYAIMDNHFHLLVKVRPGSLLTEEEVLSRTLKLYPPGIVSSHDINYWRAKLSDVSAFMKDLKQRFAQWYNTTHRRKGHLWSDRFKSIRIEEGKALLAVAAYIDLNPVRAGLTRRIDGWRFTSYSERRALSGKWLMNIADIFNGLTLKQYAELLEEAGKLDKSNAGKIEENQEPIVLHILNYKTVGIAFGGKEFLFKLLQIIPWKRNFKKIIGELSIV